MNFRKSLFSLLDHRFFCKILLINYPEEYELPGKPITFDAAATQYLNYIYSLPYSQYETYCE